MSATGADMQLLTDRANSRRSRTLFAVLAAAHLLKAFWSLDQVLVAELLQNLSICVALGLFAAGFHLAPRKSLPYRVVWFTVVLAVVAIAVQILSTINQ